VKWPIPIEIILKPFLGILMLDTRFPRIKGDIGNPDSFSFPLRKSVIEGAFPQKVVRENPTSLLPLFVTAAKALEKEGAFAITTSCGFLTLFQKELENAVDIPVLTSSLFLYNEIRPTLPANKKLGILTIAASSLSPAHLASANIKDNPPIGTTENGAEFTSAILENRDILDIEKAQNDNVSAALQLQKEHPDLGAILLECTNMPPYAGAIAKATGLPVYSIIDGLEDLWKAANKTA
jgi:Asp/Glu/hydantoin racemase